MTLQKQRQRISHKLEETINLATTKAREGRCVELGGECIATNVSPELFAQLAEAYPSAKMDYDNGRIKIIKIKGRGHKAVISVVSYQFGIFSDLLRNIFTGGGGLTPTYVYEDGLYRKTDKKADPDEALNVFRNRKSVFRVIFEVEIHNRNFAALDERMKSLLGGWPDCLIGIAVKYFPRNEDNGDFEGVLFVYYKRDGVVALEELVDVGTIELLVAHQTSLRNISENVVIKVPASEERCKIVSSNMNFDCLETTNPDFYRIKLDSDLLYFGTEFENKEDERPTLTLDFLEITERIHCVEGKMFSGALPA